jgi:hypothetical protein
LKKNTHVPCSTVTVLLDKWIMTSGGHRRGEGSRGG